MSEVGKRIAAARAYAGITSQAKLGEMIGGVSQSTMQRLEAGERDLKGYETRTLLAEIARVCGLPAAWFTADFSRLAEIPSETPGAIAEQAALRGDEPQPQAARDQTQRRGPGRAA